MERREHIQVTNTTGASNNDKYEKASNSPIENQQATTEVCYFSKKRNIVRK